MSDHQNSYQSWRNDQLKLAAVAGTALAGYWAYRKVKKHSSEIDHFFAAVFGCLGAVVLLPIWVPAYFAFWHSVAARSQEKIQRWEREAERLFHRRRDLEERVKRLGVGDQKLALEPLNQLESELKRLTTKIQRQAELWATYLYGEVRNAEENRARIVSRIEKLDQRTLEAELENNEATLEEVKRRLCVVEGDYGVGHYDTPWQAAQDRFGFLVFVAFVVGVLVALAAL